MEGKRRLGLCFLLLTVVNFSPFDLMIHLVNPPRLFARKNRRAT